MRIVALNVRAGGGTRVAALLRYPDQHNPHTMVLTEWRRNQAGAQIEAWARTRGMYHASLNDGGTANGVFIASCSQFHSESTTPIGLGPGVLMLARFETFTLRACYFPQKSAKAAFFARCAEIAEDNAAIPFLIVGDLNTGNQTADKDDHGGAFWCSVEFDRLTTNHGLIDLWRRSNGPHSREWTWLSSTKNGFRIDHAISNTAFLDWADPECRYDHTSRESRSTDHSAVIITCSGR
jgi:exonuclease III